MRRWLSLFFVLLAASVVANVPRETRFSRLRMDVAGPSVSATNVTAFYVPADTAITYDLAGNTQTDGRWQYTWDANNRLTKVESKSGAPIKSRRSVSFTYDPFGRRIARVIRAADSSGAYQEVDSRKYVYSGWKLVAELNGANNAVIRTYTWINNVLLAIRQGIWTDDRRILFDRNWDVFEDLSDFRRGDVLIAPIR